MSGIYKFKYITAIILFTALSFWIGGCRLPAGTKLIESIDSVAKNFVPDRREGIFEFTLYRKGALIVVKGETTEPRAKEEALNILRKRKTRYVDSLVVLPDTLVTIKPYGIVCVSVCNIRSEPSHSAELISQALMGTPVKILKSSSGWYFLQTPDRYLGWVDNESITTLTTQEFSRWKSSPRIIFTEKCGDIFSSYNHNFVVSDIVAGSILEKIREDSKIVYIRLPDGREGILPSSACYDFKEWALATLPYPDSLYETALRFVGTPYIWGGTSAKGMDCSGFVKTVYFLNGLILARDVSLQIRHGRFSPAPLPADSLKRGDLLFFGTIKNGNPNATHVALCIGKTEYIHSSGMVRINSLDSTRNDFSQYRFKTFLGRGRIEGYYPSEGLQKVADHPWYFNKLIPVGK